MTRSDNILYSIILSLIILFTVLSFATALAGTKSQSFDIGSKASPLSDKVDKDSDAHCGLCLEEPSGTKI